jgi:hypothetical protein
VSGYRGRRNPKGVFGMGENHRLQRAGAIGGFLALLFGFTLIFATGAPRADAGARSGGGATASCPVCAVAVFEAGDLVAPAIGAAVVSGGAAVVGQAVADNANDAYIVIRHPNSKKAARLVTFTAHAAGRGKLLWIRHGWSTDKPARIGKWFLNRFGLATLQARFPDAATGCAVAAIVTYAFQQDLTLSLQACIGGAASVLAAGPKRVERILPP